MIMNGEADKCYNGWMHVDEFQNRVTIESEIVGPTIARKAIEPTTQQKSIRLLQCLAGP